MCLVFFNRNDTFSLINAHFTEFFLFQEGFALLKKKNLVGSNPSYGYGAHTFRFFFLFLQI